MKYGALFGWGIVIYAILALVSSSLVMYGFMGTLGGNILTLVAFVIVALVAGHALRFHSWKDILPYSLGWMCIMIALDAVFYVPLIGWELYTSLNSWFWYGLVACVPLFASKMKSSPEAPHLL